YRNLPALPYSMINRARIRLLHFNMGKMNMCDVMFKLALILAASITGAALWHRTINMWTMKNLGDAFLTKDVGSRMIVLGTFFREKSEQNVMGKYAIVHFLGDSREVHDIFCHSTRANGQPMTTRAYIQRIHQGKRAANDICAWAGHIAECEVSESTNGSFRISVTRDASDALVVIPEVPKEKKQHDLAVCVAPMYIYTDWEIMLTGIETWLAMGATKIIVPIQSASETTYKILQEYEKQGIEESHVNCLFYAKSFADMIVFTDIDDMLLPVHPEQVKAGGNVEILRSIFADHPQAGSLLFEHRDTQMRLPQVSPSSLSSFNFDFLHESKSKQNCQVWRMKTRVAVKAGRVDSVNMHETGIHRFGYVQTRVPCRIGHFYHLRHSHSSVADSTPIQLGNLATILNNNWQKRLESTFSSLLNETLIRSETDSFRDFDRCMGAINEEHWTLHVSRCLTPHVCYSRLRRDMACVASTTDYQFVRSGSGYLIGQDKQRFIPAQTNCEAHVPVFTDGNHYFAP
ncbi:hypothetical protein PFISCL1PPCAC_28328, partial [Pristionchus fissidentatus]